jgi:hypothetical protein
MGLDMYAYSVDSKNLSQESNLMLHLQNGSVIAEWRKHHKLFSWMRDLYIQKTGDTETDFNLVPVVLNKNDIKTLLQEVLCNCEELPTGVTISYNKDHYLPEDLDFIEYAEKEIKKGRSIIFMGDY